MPAARRSWDQPAREERRYPKLGITPVNGEGLMLPRSPIATLAPELLVRWAVLDSYRLSPLFSIRLLMSGYPVTRHQSTATPSSFR
jgi:hypothetical protein